MSAGDLAPVIRNRLLRSAMPTPVCPASARLPTYVLSGLLLVLALIAGCDSDRAPARHHDATARRTDEALDAHRQRVLELEQRIDALTARLSASGRGAYADGPGLRLAGSKDGGNLLDRLHGLRQELTSAREVLEHRLGELEQARAQLVEAEERIARQRREITTLSETREQHAIAVDELQMRQQELEELRLELKVNELRRLRMEKLLYDFAARFLVLRPIQTQEIQDLQSDLRSEIADAAPLDPAPAEKGARP